MSCLEENYGKAKENASSVSSSTSFKNMHLQDMNRSITNPHKNGNKDNYHSTEEGNIDPELISSDANTAIHDINLQKNFFSNDKNVFGNSSAKNPHKRKEQTLKKLSEVNVSVGLINHYSCIDMD